MKELSEWFTSSQVGRILVLSALILLLQIPISSVKNLVSERQSTRSSAVWEVQNKWGGEQTLMGPVLVVPYKVHHIWRDATTGKAMKNTTEQRAVFFPNALDIGSQLKNESRYRGLYQVPLFQTEVQLQGHFLNPQLQDWGVKEEDILWDKARLVLLVSDARAIQKQARLIWNENTMEFSPGSDKALENMQGYHVPLKGVLGERENYTFDFNLILNGSNGLYFTPVGNESRIRIRAPWPHPSFQGKWLPTSREVGSDGFMAQWQIPYLSRDFSEKSQDFKEIKEKVAQSAVGVNFVAPVDSYRMTDRSIKYVILFLFMTFVVIWLIELLAGFKVHFMQYLFIGVALCVFFLLELSLAEHLGFYWAYTIAAVSVVALVSSYSLFVLKTGKRVAILTTGLLLMYAYLFTLLQEQNYSLLIGAVGVFVMLAAVMFLTRHVDWVRFNRQAAAAVPREPV